MFPLQAFISNLPSSTSNDGWIPLHRMAPLWMASPSPSSSGRVYSPSPTKTKKRRQSRAKSSSSGGRPSTRSSKPNVRQKQSTSQPPRQKKQTQKENIKVPIDEAKTMGEGIQLAQSISDYLKIAEKFVWLPTDDNLQPHLRTQLVHHEKRRRWGSQLLEGLGHAALSTWEENPMDLKQSLMFLEGEESKIWTDERFVRAVMSVALPMKVDSEEEVNRPEKEGAWIAAALKGLHILSGCVVRIPPSSEATSQELQTWVNLLRGISTMIRATDRLSDQLTLKDSAEVRWAIRGLTVRLQMANTALSNNVALVGDEAPVNIDNGSILDFTTPNLNARTSNLPFDIFSHCLPWQISPSSPSNHYYGYPSQDLLPRLLESIPFHFDTLITRTGDSVIERRGTAWLAEDGIGALAYSGKLMRPAEVPNVVREIMREMEHWCIEQGQSQMYSMEQRIVLPTNDVSLDSSSSSFVDFKWDDGTSTCVELAYQELGEFLEPDYQERSNISPAFFDCALCNHYPDGDSACKFHTDPEHGTHWHRTTAVVSCGTSRGFAFRPIPEVSTWSEWDDIDKNILTKDTQQHGNTPASLQLFPGDVVFMTGSCNDLFHHAVYASPCDNVGIDSSRVSLVFKRALDRGGGKKGHGLAGEGRRSRQRNRRL